MEKIIKGISAFKESGYEERKKLFAELATGQSPEVLFITCADSRIDPGLITQTEPGDLFICRNAGNIVPPHNMATSGITASIEYAVAVLGVKDIVVCGHTDCGAMKGAMNPQSVKSLPHVSNWLANSASALARVKARHNGDIGPEHTLEMIQENALQQLQHLETHPSVAAKLAVGEINLHAWVYDIKNGEVTCYDPAKNSFIPVQEWWQKAAKTA